MKIKAHQATELSISFKNILLSYLAKWNVQKQQLPPFVISKGSKMPKFPQMNIIKTH